MKIVFPNENFSIYGNETFYCGIEENLTFQHKNEFIIYPQKVPLFELSSFQDHFTVHGEIARLNQD